MTAIPCKYSVPYAHYNPPPGVSVGLAYAVMAIASDFDIATYVYDTEAGDSRLVMHVTELVDGGPNLEYDFLFALDATPEPGYIIIDISTVTTNVQLATAIAAALSGNTGLTVAYTAGQNTLRITQPVETPAGVNPLEGFPIVWSQLDPTGETGTQSMGPCHPSGITVNGNYAPTPTVTLPGNQANGVLGVNPTDFVATALIGGSIEIARYTGVGVFPWVVCTIEFVASAGPVTPNVAYVVIPGALSAAQVAGLLAVALESLGFEALVNGNNVNVSQPIAGPGGNARLLGIDGTGDLQNITWTAPDSSEFLVNSGNPLAFRLGDGPNLFVDDPSGPYGGNVIPLRFGKNYGMLPLE